MSLEKAKSIAFEGGVDKLLLAAKMIPYAIDTNDEKALAVAVSAATEGLAFIKFAELLEKETKMVGE
jgi:hypothetical protein